MATTSDTRFILIVDDNPTNLSVLSEALSNAGFRFLRLMEKVPSLKLNAINQS
jgi:CheY-like chemotaxis protein